MRNGVDTKYMAGFRAEGETKAISVILMHLSLRCGIVLPELEVIMEQS